MLPPLFPHFCAIIEDEMKDYERGIGDHSDNSWRDVKEIRDELITKGVKLPVLLSEIKGETPRALAAE